MVLGDLAERMRLFCVASMQRCVRDTPGKTVANVEARKGALGSVCVSMDTPLQHHRYSMCQH